MFDSNDDSGVQGVSPKQYVLNYLTNASTPLDDVGEIAAAATGELKERLASARRLLGLGDEAAPKAPKGTRIRRTKDQIEADEAAKRAAAEAARAAQAPRIVGAAE